MSFVETLRIELTVVSSGRQFPIAAEDVKSLDLDLRRAGFTGTVEFRRRDDAHLGGMVRDELAEVFLAPEELSLRLSVTPARLPAESTSEPEPLVLPALARRRAVKEESSDWSKDRPLLWRRYRIEFGDPARTLWSQHHPCELLRDRSLLDVVTSQAPADVRVQSSWQVAQEVQRQWFLHLPDRCGASFYDFLVWYLEERGGRWIYDYASQAYEIVGEPSSSEAKKLFGDDVAEVELVLPEPLRAQPRVRNSYAQAAETVEPEMDRSVAPLVRDRLIRTPVAERQSRRADEEKLRGTSPALRAELSFARSPSAAVCPGVVLACPAGSRFAGSSMLVESDWVVRRVRLEACVGDDIGGGSLAPDAIPMNVRLSATLGKLEDETPEGWECVPPRYPGYVEGIIVSQQGEESDKTWDMAQDGSTKLDEVEVSLPLFGENVFVPFEPGTLPANVFLPHCRGARVLVALDLEESWIVRTLGWREGAALPKDGQGERVVFGKSESSNTKLTHAYDEGSPVFGLLRVNEQDQVALTFSEGKLVLGVVEGAG